MPRLAAFITPHGYGHAAIVTAVVNTLLARHSDLQVTFVTTVPEGVLAERVNGPVRVIGHAGRSDFGLLMSSSTGIRVDDSLAAYAAAHADWPAVVAADAEILRQIAPDVVVSCAGYACLAAAAGMGVPAVCLGPFSWRMMLANYCGDRPEAARILADMDAAYGAAEVFLETAPAVPTGLPHAVPIGPVGGPARMDGAVVRRRLEVAAGRPLAVLAMGGIPESLSAGSWSALDAAAWLSAGDAGDGLTPVGSVGLSVSEAIAACDVVVTKPGYGTFVEAACGGTALIYRDRPDWPETAGLHTWLADYVPVARIDAETFSAGAFGPQLQKMLQSPRRPLSHPFGNDQAADFIEKYF